MSQTTPRRERALHMIREERTRQIEQYGTNEGLETGFGGSVPSYPWLRPYSLHTADEIERKFRENYEQHVFLNGEPTWMHLIREEVAEFFAATTREHMITEGIQVAALIVSLIELELGKEEDEAGN